MAELITVVNGFSRAIARVTVRVVAGTIIVFMSIFMNATASVSADDPTAREVVQHTSDELLDLIEEARDYVDEDPERFYVAVEALLSPVVDFSGFARNVMAVYYKKATDVQRSNFAESFKWGLVRSYSLALTEFSEGEVVLVPADRPPRSPTRESVKMEIRTSTGETYPLVYSMALGKDQTWRVRNIIVNGVNLGLTYRNQFASAASNNKYGSDLDAVIESWADVLRNDAEEDMESAGEGPVGVTDEAGL